MRRTHGEASIPGEKITEEYKAWQAMKTRCYNPNRKQWGRWGGRGIVVCVRWRGSYESFLVDMGRKPSPKHSLDRIDNDGNYEPGNCRWATRREQANNSTKARIIELDGELLSLREWGRKTGIHWQTISSRLELGWSTRDALTRPVDSRKGARKSAA